MRIPTSEEILAARTDYRSLDTVRILERPGMSVISTEDFPGPQHRKIEPAGIEQLPWLGPVLFGISLLARCRSRHCLLLNEVDRHAQLACIFNFLLPFRKRKIVLYDVFIDTPSPVKRMLVRWMVKGATVNVLFSKNQVDRYAQYYQMPAERFIFIPYQSSHSKRPPVSCPHGSYIWSGGNSARDYATLFAAVKDTGIPVKVTTTLDLAGQGLDIPENVELVPAQEPHFTQLMAGSRFVVLTLTPDRIRGYGEQSMLNSMWHGRPVVVADDVSADDYIDEGNNGYRVEPGDVAGLRKCIRALWQDPDRSQQMGRQAYDWVAQGFTHDHFIRRMKNFALLIAGN